MHSIALHRCKISTTLAIVAMLSACATTSADNAPLTGYLFAGGRYVDRLEKRGGEWKIANRYCIVEWSGTINPGPIPYADIPDVHASGIPSRDRSDPSYARPLVNKRAKRKP